MEMAFMYHCAANVSVFIQCPYVYALKKSSKRNKTGGKGKRRTAKTADAKGPMRSALYVGARHEGRAEQQWRLKKKKLLTDKQTNNIVVVVVIVSWKHNTKHTMMMMKEKKTLSVGEWLGVCWRRGADWASPLTAPTTAAVAVATGDAAAATTPAKPTEQPVEVNVDADVVDGHPASVLHMRQHQALNTTRPLTAPAPAAAASKQSPPVAVSFDASAHVNGGSAAYQHAYMTNVLASTVAAPAPATLPASPLQSTAGARFGAADNMDDVSASAVHELSQRLQAKLRAAKSRHLACTEVTLPYDLTERIAAEIIRMSEREPCGERACTIFIEFESEPNNVRRIASFKVDPDTVSIFELYLTLKQDKSGWTSLLPQFLKNLTRSNTIMISPDFTLTKNKLYSSE